MLTPLLITRPQHEDITTTADISEVSDRLQAMRIQEETTAYKCYTYFVKNDHNNKISFGGDVNEECRYLMCQWCYQVVDYCNFQRETVSIAFSYLDRYMCTPHGQSTALHDKRLYQLAAMTSLYIAAKTHEPVALGLELLCDQSRGVYCQEDFREMERQILMALEWRMNGPTPLAFVRCFLALLPDDIDETTKRDILEYSRRQVELSLFDSSLFMDCLSSEIAVAAIVNCVMEMSHNLLSFETKGNFFRDIEKFCGYPIINTLAAQSGLSRLLVCRMPSGEQTGLQSTTCSQTERKIMPTESTTALAGSPVSVGIRQ